MSTLLAKIHIGKKALGLDDDVYRALLTRVTGKSSSSAMTEAERQAVVDEMVRQGFKPTSKAVGKRVLSGPYAKKAQALWIAGWNLGLIRDRSDKALLAFFERQTGIQRSEWVLAAEDGKAVLEALKTWLERDGGVGWNAGRGAPLHAHRHGYQIATAQWRRLHGSTINWLLFWMQVEAAIGRRVDANKPTDAEWIPAMDALGRQVRAAAAAAEKAA